METLLIKYTAQKCNHKMIFTQRLNTSRQYYSYNVTRHTETRVTKYLLVLKSVHESTYYNICFFRILSQIFYPWVCVSRTQKG
jgi:hypothetical protein